MNNPREQLAAEARSVIARAGIQKSAVADALGITPEALSKKLWGRSEISVEDVATIARVTGANPGAMVNAAFGVRGEAA